MSQLNILKSIEIEVSAKTNTLSTAELIFAILR